MSETTLVQKERQTDVEKQSFTDFDVLSSDGREVRVKITENETTRRISHGPGGKKIDIDNEKRNREISFPTVNETYSRLVENVFQVEIPRPETVPETEIQPYFTGFILFQPREDARAESFIPMNGVGSPEREVPRIRVPELEEQETEIERILVEPEKRYNYQETGDREYPGVQHVYTVFEETVDPYYIFLGENFLQEPVEEQVAVKPDPEDFPGIDRSYETGEIQDYDDGREVSRRVKARVTERMTGEEGTLEEALEHLIDSGQIQGAIMETPYYSETGGENFEKGWNTHPQIVNLEGFNSEIMEYRINGELAEDDIGTIEVEPGDEIEIEEAEMYGSHGNYTPSQETYKEWVSRYGERIWDEEWDSIDRQIYAALEEGEQPIGEIDLKGRKHVIQALEEEQYSMPGNEADYVTAA